jgi:predicted DNA-binding transcriptional regulator YafY
MTHPTNHDFALRTLLTRVLKRLPIIGGGPLQASHAASAYEVPERDVERVLDSLVRDGIAVRSDNGYQLSEQL